jgi:hypothetical protein
MQTENGFVEECAGCRRRWMPASPSDPTLCGRCATEGKPARHPHTKYPRERLEQVAAVVFACLIPGELQIMLLPTIPCGIARGAERMIPMDLVPFKLRMPNTAIWVQFDDDLNIVRVWDRNETESG